MSTEKYYLGRGAITLQINITHSGFSFGFWSREAQNKPPVSLYVASWVPDKELTVPGGASPGWRTILSVFPRGCFPALLFLHKNIERTCQQLHETAGQAWRHVFCLYTFQNLENGDGMMVQADTVSHQYLQTEENPSTQQHIKSQRLCDFWPLCNVINMCLGLGWHFLECLTKQYFSVPLP